MSMIKRHLENEIAALATLTGYDPDFLMSIWLDMLDDGDNDFEYFKGVTLERDW